jgi:hypothetical protein
MFLPIMTSRELLNSHLVPYETLLVHLQKKTFCASMSRKHPHTLPFTIETVSMHQAATWIASNLRYPPFECTISLSVRNIFPTLTSNEH